MVDVPPPDAPEPDEDERAAGSAGSELAGGELRKRKRERRIAVFFAIAFLVSTLVQAFLTSRREAYGFVQSLLYFGLVHLNVILVMFLVFLVTRNLIKAWIARRAGRLGSSLRWRMVTSLLAFSLLPSVLLFVGSSYIIRQGFDRWFGGQVSKALEDAQAITQVHYEGIENNLDFFSNQITTSLERQHNLPTQTEVEALLKQHPVQAIEIYTDLMSPPLRALRPDLPTWAVPRAAVETLQKAFASSTGGFRLIRQYGDGDLVQRFAVFHFHPPIGDEGTVAPRRMVLVLSHTVPLGLKTRIADLHTAFSGYQRTLSFKEPLKANYTLILLTLFVLILFVVSWFGLYIAKSVTDPVSELMRATEAFRAGRWDYRIRSTIAPVKGSLQGLGTDLEVLKAAFNLMAEEVGRRGRQLEEANVQLISLVRELEDRERYLETLLSSIRRGVLVLDNGARIQRINSEALEFRGSGGEPGINELVTTVIGEPWRQVFPNFGTAEEARAWLEEARSLRGRSVDRIFEIETGSGASSSLRSVRATGISLIDDRLQPMGWLIILEDVSDAARLERLAAWQEVARRVAHEIKNPLTPIQISADRLMRRMGGRMESDLDDGPVFLECVGQIQKQVRVIRDLVREFSQFAKLPEPRFANVNLVELLERILGDYRFTHPGSRFLLDNHFAPGEAVWVRADAEYLRRLVVNLADNALHSLEEAKISAPYFKITLSPSTRTESFVAIAFEDNGPGVPPALREKIFDPYVTSKASGLGLGLPIVRRIAIEHSGRIRCEEVEVGARFVLELPRLLTLENVETRGA